MIEKIEQKQIDDNSVSKLSTRPNAPSAMGGNGLNAAELRARFDALAKLAIDKINEILAYLNGDELKDGTTAPPFASLIKFTGDGGTYTLYEVLEWLQSKDFAEKIILSEDGKYTLAQFYDDFNEWLAGTGFAEKINLVAVANGENYTLAQFYQDFNITPSFGTLKGVEHFGNENIDIIHDGGISYTSKLRFLFQDFCYPTNQEFPNETLIPIVNGEHIEFSPDDRGKVVEISAIVDQSFSPNSTEAQSGKAVSGAIQPLSESIAKMQNKISSLEAQVDLYPLFTFHSNQNMEAIVSGYTDTISFNRVVDGKTEEVFNKEPSVGDIFFAYGQSADGVRFHMTAVITAIDDTDNPSQATFKALEVYEDAGEGGISIDPNYDPNSLNAQSGKAVAEAIESVEEQIPLVLPYIFKWGKNAPITKGETNTVAAKYFNRIPKKEDHFFGYFYIESIENGEITHKDYHVSAVINVDVPPDVDPEKAIEFKVLEAVQYIPTADQTYQPTSTNPQSGKAVAEAISKVPKVTITQEPGESETLVMSQKAVTELVADALGGDTTQYETVDSVDQMTDTTKQYVLASTGTVWTYTTKDIYVEHNAYDANTAVFNTRLNGSGEEQAFNGAVVMGDYIDQAYNENCIVTIDGFESLSSIWGTDQTTASFGIAYYDSNKNFLGIAYNGSFGKKEWADLASPISFSAFKPTDKPDAARNAVYVRVYVCLKYQTAISATNCAGLTINFSTKNGYQKISTWEDTGVVPTYKTVNGVEEMTDTTKRYVLASTGTVWAYTEETIAVEKNLFSPSDSETRINKRIIASGYTNQNGAVTTNYFPYDYSVLSKKDTAEKFMVKFSNTIGENIFKTGYNTFVYFYGSDISSAAGYIGSNYIMVDSKVRHDIETDGEGNVYIDPTSATAWASEPAWDDVKYIRFVFNPNGDQNTIDLSDIEDIEIFTLGTTEYVTEGEWKDTGLSPTQGGGGNYVELLVKINENAAQIHELDKRVTTIESESGTVTIPSYWEETVAEKVQTVKALQSAGGKDCVCFAWAADTHIPDNNGGWTNSLGKLMAKMLDECEIPFAVLSGDIGTQASCATEAKLVETHEQLPQHLAPLWGTDRLLLALGNHDGVWGEGSATNLSGYYSQRFTQEKMWQLYFRGQALDFRREFSDNGLYFYVDNKAQKTRFIVLNSHFAADNTEGRNVHDTSCYGQAQLDWLADVALDMPSGYGAVIVAHVPPIKIRNASNEYTVDHAQLKGIINAYNNKTTFSGSYTAGTDGWSNSTVSVDFTDAEGEIIAMFVGHIHEDTIDTTTLSCPLLTIVSAGASVDGGAFTRTQGKDTETSFDVVIINRATRTIKCVRVGAGTDRKTSY